MGQRGSAEAARLGQASPPPEAQVVAYDALRWQAWDEDDQKKMIRVSEEDLAPEEEVDPLASLVASLPPFPSLGPAAVRSRWDLRARGTDGGPSPPLETLKPAPLVELLAKFQTYSMKRCNLVYHTQTRLLTSIHTADLALNRLNNVLLARQDAVRRLQLRLGEVPKLQQATETTHALLADIVSLLHDIHSFLPARVKAGVPLPRLPVTHQAASSSSEVVPQRPPPDTITSGDCPTDPDPTSGSEEEDAVVVVAPMTDTP